MDAVGAKDDDAIGAKPLATGSLARIKGLTGRADLNGAHCEVLSFDAERVRFACEIKGSGERVLFRPDNLEQVDATNEDEAKECMCCAAPLANPLRCSACQAAWYCSAGCQRRNWKEHKPKCEAIKREKVLANTQKGAEELIEADAMRVVVHTPRIYVTRCSDPDDTVCKQVMPEAGINDWLQANGGCFCKDVGKRALSTDAQVVVSAFRLSQLERLAQPVSEIQMSDTARERGSLESSTFSAFGTRLQVVVSPAMGSLSVSLKEIPPDPAMPLDSVRGIQLRCCLFYLEGSDPGVEERGLPLGLALPPQMARGRNAGTLMSNCELHTWCGVGESACLSISSITKLPRFPAEELAKDPFNCPPESEARGQDAAAVVVLFEKVCADTGPDEFEAGEIRNFLHHSHSQRKPETGVPRFARELVKDWRALAALSGYDSNGLQPMHVLWMH